MSGRRPRCLRSTWYLSLSVILISILMAPVALAQVTTGAIAGAVTTQADGSALPGVTIEAVHVPTGTTYTSVSGENGRYLIPNVRVGGPYKITATLSGFQTAEVSGVQVNLGATSDVPFAMHVAAVSETISVTATADVINPNRSGSTSEVATEQITSLPTVNRSLQDFARTNPYFATAAYDSSSTVLSVAGRNNRYNTIQIDGAVDNDLFGLAASGTPGGQSNTQPIALDAIQELQLVVSPYDVRQGGFTGGGINAVTRSGSNDFEGSFFWDKRNENYVGNGPFHTPIANFSQDQYGGRFGGPIIKDKLFFFVSGEHNNRQEPTGWSADGSTPQVVSASIAADAAALKSFLTSTYNYDPGSLGDIAGTTKNTLGFIRFDWNANANNNVTLRHNYVDASNDIIANHSSASVFRFPSAQYAIADKTNSTVAQVNSVFSSTMFNEGRIGYQTIKDARTVPVIFPSIEIGGTGPRNGALLAGTERFSGANSLDQTILEVTDDFTWIKGNHTLLFGTHNEFFEFKNLFLSDFYGYYYFPTLAAFEAGTPSSYSITFATGSDPRRPTQFKANQIGFYVGDTWRVNDQTTLIFGLRADKPQFPDTPSLNQSVVDAIGYHTDVTPSSDFVLSPRIGFNWTPATTVRQQIRGGVGIFAGRTPYVWISNAYGNTGVEQVALSCNAPSCTTPFVADPDNQPKNFAAGGGAISVDGLDKNFKFPRVLRTTLGYDRELPWGIRGSVEGVYSKTQEDVYYINLNRVQTGTSPLDGRPTYSKISTVINDIPYLTNTTKGDELTTSLQFVKPFSHGFTATASYAYQDAKSAFDATSSRAISNWQYMPSNGDIFTPVTATSPFEIKNRFNVSASYDFKTGMLNHTVGLYFNAQSGAPYTLLMGGDPNKDGYFTNDILYVPASADQIILKNSAGVVEDYSKLTAFLQSAGIDPTAGRILNRYESFAPWLHELDFHYQIGIPFRGVSTDVTVDVLNLLNMMDSSWGVVRYVSNQTYTPIKYQGIDTATGKPIYQENFSGALNPGRQYSTGDTRSRWQARVGLRVTF